MEIDSTLIIFGVSGLASAGVAFGIVKGRMYNYMTYDKHREICTAERKETREVEEKLFDGQREMHGMIKEIHGFLKAKNGGSL